MTGRLVSRSGFIILMIHSLVWVLSLISQNQQNDINSEFTKTFAVLGRCNTQACRRSDEYRLPHQKQIAFICFMADLHRFTAVKIEISGPAVLPSLGTEPITRATRTAILPWHLQVLVGSFQLGRASKLNLLQLGTDGRAYIVNLTWMVWTCEGISNPSEVQNILLIIHCDPIK